MMIAVVSIATTDNQRRTYIQDSQKAFDDLCSGLQRYQQLFKKKSIVLASRQGTQIFNSRYLARVEIDSVVDIKTFLPSNIDTTITALKPGQPVPSAILTEGLFSGQVDFHFAGGDQLSTWIQEERSGHPIDRVAGFNHIFDVGAIPYISAGGGIGFMNTENLVLLQVHAPTAYQPKDCWHAEPCHTPYREVT